MRYCLLTVFSILQLVSRSQLREADKIRIGEAEQIIRTTGSQIWPLFSDTPFTLLLLTDSGEYLIHHPQPSSEFRELGFDSVLQTTVYWRPSVYQKTFLATFPAVNGLNTIVVGTPENTQRSSTQWIVTLLHEHFHLYTYLLKDYYASVEGLGLSGGDQTGMWMLNYPFPYTEPKVEKQYAKYARSLQQAIASLNTGSSKTAIMSYKQQRSRFKGVMSANDYTYFSFQVWQEGLARYTEYKFLLLLASYKPSGKLLALPDFIPFKKLAQKMYSSEVNNLLQNKLSEAKRVSFYSVGFAEGLLLDKVNPAWRKRYLTEKFYIEKYF